MFLIAGLERVDVAPADTAFTPLAFVHYPWTHSLAAAVTWGVLFGLAFFKLGKRAASVLGLLVASHWVLDALVHRPDLPLWPGSDVAVGLGLWNSVPATLAFETLLFAAAVRIYVRCAPARSCRAALPLWSLVALLGVLYVANAFGPPPPNAGAVAVAGIAGGLLFPLWAWWADRQRDVTAVA